MRPGGIGAGLIAVCLWGLAPVATRGLVSQVAPLPLLTMRQLLAASVLLPWAVPVVRRISARDLPRFVAAGLLIMIGYNLPVTVGLQWLPASSVGLLLATEPVWVLVISRVFLGERAGPQVLAGSGVALGGVAVIAGPSALSSGYGMRAVAGAALVVLATMAFAGYTIVLRPLSEKYGPVPATAVSTVAGAVPYLAFVGSVWPPRLSQPAWAELLFLALGSTVAGMLLWNQAIVRGGSGRISRLLYLEPVVSVLGAMVFLGERATAAVLIGGVLVIAGVLMAAAGPRRSAGSRPDPGRACDQLGDRAGEPRLVLVTVHPVTSGRPSRSATARTTPTAAPLPAPGRRQPPGAPSGLAGTSGPGHRDLGAWRGGGGPGIVRW